MTIGQKDSILDNECRNISLSTTEVLNEIEILRQIKGNEVVAEGSLSSKREYVALSEAEELVILQLERDKLLDSSEKHKQALEELLDSKWSLTDKAVSDAIRAGIAAIEVLCDLHMKLENHRKVLTKENW